jgi:large subunit ribosomal protein L33
MEKGLRFAIREGGRTVGAGTVTDILEKGTLMRDNIILQCPECKRRNYATTKNKKKTTERLELSKYCRFCRKHTSHKETK